MDGIVGDDHDEVDGQVVEDFDDKDGDLSLAGEGDKELCGSDFRDWKGDVKEVAMVDLQLTAGRQLIHRYITLLSYCTDSLQLIYMEQHHLDRIGSMH